MCLMARQDSWELSVLSSSVSFENQVCLVMKSFKTTHGGGGFGGALTDLLQG
jgi:hypothetical protein